MVSGGPLDGLDFEDETLDRYDANALASGDRRGSVGAGLPQRVTDAHDTVRVNRAHGLAGFTDLDVVRNPAWAIRPIWHG